MKPSWLDSPVLETPRRVNSVGSLKQLQKVMSVALYRPLTDDGDLQDTWIDDAPMADVAGTFIKPNDELTSCERLEIYNQVYWYRILNALADDFPAVRTLIGDRRFEALSRAYLSAHPSESWTLRNLGRCFVKFIQTEPRWTRSKTSLAVDVARVEWAQVLAFDEAARSPARGDDLLGRSPGELRLDLQPHVVLLELGCLADDFVHEVKAQGAGLRSETSNVTDHGPERAKLKKVSPPRKQDLWLAVHRCDNRIFFKRLEREAFLTLTALKDGRTLLEALDGALADASPEIDWAERVRGWFANWAELGWLCERTS